MMRSFQIWKKKVMSAVDRNLRKLDSTFKRKCKRISLQINQKEPLRRRTQEGKNTRGQGISSSTMVCVQNERERFEFCSTNSH